MHAVEKEHPRFFVAPLAGAFNDIVNTVRAKNAAAVAGSVLASVGTGEHMADHGKALPLDNLPTAPTSERAPIQVHLPVDQSRPPWTSRKMDDGRVVHRFSFSLSVAGTESSEGVKPVVAVRHVWYPCKTGDFKDFLR